MKKDITLIILFLLFLILIPGLIKADGLVPCGKNCDIPGTPPDECHPCGLCDIFVMFDRIIDFIMFQIVPSLAVLMIAIGGFMLVVSHLGGALDLGGGKQGGSALVSRAKTIFKSVIIGLFIIYGAWLIVNTFFMMIGVADWTGLRSGWWQINCQ